MYTKKDFIQIDREYFEVICETCYHIQIKSKNTGHIWNIECRCPRPGVRSLIVKHKHKHTHAFHQQRYTHPRSILEAQEIIKAHDKWHLEGRK